MPTDYYETLGQEDIDWGTDVVAKRNPGGGTLSTTQVNLASFARGQASVTATWAPATIADGSQVSTTVAYPGSQLTDKVIVSLNSIGTNDLILSAHVSMAGTVKVVLANMSGASVTLPSGTLSILAFETL